MEVCSITQGKEELAWSLIWVEGHAVLAWVGWIMDFGKIGICCCGKILLCDWVTGSFNGIISFGLSFGIGRRGIWLPSGMGRATLGFLLIPALPCPTLGFGIGGSWFVCGVWCLGLRWHTGGIGHENFTRFSGLTWGTKTFFALCTSGNLMLLDLTLAVVCTM